MHHVLHSPARSWEREGAGTSGRVPTARSSPPHAHYLKDRAIKATKLSWFTQRWPAIMVKSRERWAGLFNGSWALNSPSKSLPVERVTRRAVHQHPTLNGEGSFWKRRDYFDRVLVYTCVSDALPELHCPEERHRVQLLLPPQHVPRGGQSWTERSRVPRYKSLDHLTNIGAIWISHKF